MSSAEYPHGNRIAFFREVEVLMERNPWIDMVEIADEDPGPSDRTSSGGPSTWPSQIVRLVGSVGVLACNASAIGVSTRDFVLLIGTSVLTPAAVAATFWVVGLLLLLTLITTTALRRHRRHSPWSVGSVGATSAGAIMLIAVVGSAICAASATVFQSDDLFFSNLKVIPETRSGPCVLVADEDDGFRDAEVRVYPIDHFGIGIPAMSEEDFSEPTTPITDGAYTVHALRARGGEQVHRAAGSPCDPAGGAVTLSSTHSCRPPLARAASDCSTTLDARRASSEHGIDRIPGKSRSALGGSPWSTERRSGRVRGVELLLLGGSVWLGHEIAGQARKVGHAVTCLTRGPGVPPGVTHVGADRDHDDALHEVRGRRWDAVIDVARQPGHVRRAVRDLESVADHYVFVSSGSVYASQAEINADEDAARLPALQADTMASPEDYGGAKVACEDAVIAAFGRQRATIVRSGLIGGPGDSTGRTDYWPWRFARPAALDGAVLVPDVPDLPASVIDVRDLAAWIIQCADRRVPGIFNAFGAATTVPHFIAAAGAVAGHEGPVMLASERWLIDHDVREWSGPRSLPLWLADRSWYGMNARSNARAMAAGLVLRPLEHTLADALEARLDNPDGPRGEAGLSDDEERDLLAQLRR